MNSPKELPVAAAVSAAFPGQVPLGGMTPQEEAAWKEELQTEAKYRAAAVAAQDPEAGGVPGMWREIITDGHVWVARINKLFVPVGAAFLTLYLASVSWDIYQVTTGSVKAVEAARTAKDAGWFERLTTSPWATIKGAVVGAVKDESGPRPEINPAELAKIRWQSATTLTAEDVDAGLITKASDAPKYIDLFVASLNKTGSLPKEIQGTPVSFPELSDLRSEWSNPATGKYDMPRTKTTGDAVWMVSALALERNGVVSGVAPWISVFHKTEKGWNYQNVRLPSIQTYAVPGYDSIDISMVPYAFAKAFPALVKPAEPKETTKGDAK